MSPHPDERLAVSILIGFVAGAVVALVIVVAVHAIASRGTR